jgi:exopolysaccharide production protein ExoQ
MTGNRPGTKRLDAILEFVGTPRFSAALSTAIIGAAFFSFLLKNLIGWAGLFAILAGLVAFAALSLIGQRDILEWRGFLPFSLLAFLGWSAISIIFSQYQWASLGGIAYQFAFALLGVYVALARDFIQIVRIVGNVLRAVIGMSLVAELVVGVLLDTSFPFLGILGRLGAGGPIQGVMGTRNQLGLVALLALVTFGTEVLTRSINRTIGIASLVFASFTILLSQSPVNLGVLAVLGIASLGLLGLRRVSVESRRYWLWGLGTAAIVALIILFAARDRVLALLGATGDFKYRLGLWNNLFPFIQLRPLQGWGWVGQWPPDIVPFGAIDPSIDHLSALNAYLDVWFQLGVIGLIAFLLFAALAIVRAWVLATQKRSRVFVWPALVLVALIATSTAESGVLIEWGWLILVVCSVKVAQHLRWRQPLTSE